MKTRNFLTLILLLGSPMVVAIFAAGLTSSPLVGLLTYVVLMAVVLLALYYTSTRPILGQDDEEDR